MKKLYSPTYLFLLAVAISICTGCAKTSWYDVKPDKSLAVPETLEALQVLMNNGEVFVIVTPSLGEIGSDGHYIASSTFSIMDDVGKNAYTWSHTKPYAKLFEWNLNGERGAFVKIFYCNVVLDQLKKIKPVNAAEEAQWNNIKGQALFFRAKSFFDIAEVFAPVYNTATADKEPGVPLRLEADPSVPSKRATMRQSYDQIINDLLMAKTLLPAGTLPATPLLKCRPTVTAASAMLARVYLAMEEYKKAGQSANDALDNYNYLLDYNKQTGTFSSFGTEVILHTVMSSQYHAARPGVLLIDTAWYNKYDINDLRRTQFFNYNSATGLVSYRGGYAGQGALYSGLAVDELYLIRAECAARAGNVTAAMKDVNTLRLQRWKDTVPYPALVANTAEEALYIVLEERKKELLLRGLRWSDLRRLNRDDRFKTTITRNAGSTTFTLEPGSYKYTFPIPDDIIQLSGMQQNSGW